MKKSKEFSSQKIDSTREKTVIEKETAVNFPVIVCEKSSLL